MLSYETAAVCQQTRAAQHFGTVDNSAGSLFTLLKQTLLCIPMEPTDRKNQQIRPYSHLNKSARGFGGAQNTQSTTICAGTQGSILMCFFPSWSVYSESKGSSNTSEIYSLIQHKPSSCHSTSNSPHGSTTAGTSRTGSATVGFPSPTHNQVLWCDKSGHPVLG